MEGRELAIKKMYDPFNSEVRARRVFRELKLLQLISHENIIRFVDVYTPEPDLASFRNLFIVTEYAGISLRQVLDQQRHLNEPLITHEHVKYIIYQVLRAMKYLHSANVIHRDLKPSNLAITEQCDVTVLDFGLARTVSTDTPETLTSYVISRWYRSPEVIYWNNVSYNAKADVWSVGCILAELLTGHVLFPGSEAMEQYKLITTLCGCPDEELMEKVEAQNSHSMRLVMERLGENRARRDFREVFGAFGISPQAVDLLDRILVLDPDRRISVEEALQHPYMAEYAMPSDEPVVSQPFSIDDQDSDAQKRTLEEWKEIIWREIQSHGASKMDAEESAERRRRLDDALNGSDSNATAN